MADNRFVRATIIDPRCLIFRFLSCQSVHFFNDAGKNLEKTIYLRVENSSTLRFDYDATLLYEVFVYLDSNKCKGNTRRIWKGNIKCLFRSANFDSRNYKFEKLCFISM